MHKLKEKDKIVLSSFGQRGTRYFTTNCDNCPFGTTKESCKKEALSFIISSFHDDYGIDLSIDDLDDVESNQALLKMKRIIMNAKKEKSTKMEQNLGANLDKIFGRVVENSLELSVPRKITMNDHMLSHNDNTPHTLLRTAKAHRHPPTHVGFRSDPER